MVCTFLWRKYVTPPSWNIKKSRVKKDDDIQLSALHCFVQKIANWLLYSLPLRSSSLHNVRHFTSIIIFTVNLPIDTIYTSREVGFRKNHMYIQLHSPASYRDLAVGARPIGGRIFRTETLQEDTEEPILLSRSLLLPATESENSAPDRTLSGIKEWSKNSKLNRHSARVTYP